MRLGKKKWTMAVLVAAAIGCSSLGSAYAAVKLEPINAWFNKSVAFVLQGERWQPKDGSGKALDPITYNGATYLPVRALSEALRVPIEYDGTAQIIYIGGKPGAKTSIFAMPMEIDNVYVVSSKNPEDTLVNGKAYGQVLKIDQYGDIVLTLNRQYKRLVLEAAVVSPGEHEVEFSLYNASEEAASTADTILEKHAVSPEDQARQLTYNVEGLDKIRIHVQSPNLNPYIYARIMDSSYLDNGEASR